MEVFIVPASGLDRSLRYLVEGLFPGMSFLPVRIDESTQEDEIELSAYGERLERGSEGTAIHQKIE